MINNRIAEGIDDESIAHKLPEWPQPSVNNSGDSTPVENDNETKTESSVIEPKDFQALIIEKMESENLSFPEAREQVLKERKIDAVSSPIEINLEKKIQTLAFKDFNQTTGKFGWNYPVDFKRKLEFQYPNVNFSLREIERTCSLLQYKFILCGRKYEEGMKYVFERKNLKV